MKILILGAGGMLGHKMTLELKNNFEVYTTTRSSYKIYKKFNIFEKNNHISNLNVTNEVELTNVIQKVQPNFILNCVGITTRKIDDIHSDEVIKINSLLPHTLLKICKLNNYKLIHFSTDCVFDGKKEGKYFENDTPNAKDLYGLSKILGEVDKPQSITIRSSIIGRELFHKTELLEWLIQQSKLTINGFSNVIYSGVTTNAMAKVVKKILMNHSEISGIFQLSSPEISKYDLLNKINDSLNLGVKILKSETPVSNKSLDSARLTKILNITEELQWDNMILDLKNENQKYLNWSDYDI